MDQMSEALRAAVAAWQHRRHPRLADAVDAASRTLLQAAPRPALRVSKRKADLEAWAALERQRDLLDFPRLAAALDGGQQADVQRQVEALAQWEDPRFAAALLALLEQPPYAGVRSRGMLRAVLDALAATADGRAAGPTRELARRYLAIVDSSTGGWMVHELERVATGLERAAKAELAADDERLCAAIEAAAGAAPTRARTPGTQPVQELLDAVYAAPDDDAPRLVLADALMEQGDAYGDFIRLQLTTPRDRAAEAGLLRSKQVAPWVHALAVAGQCVYERGFAHEVALYRTGAKSANQPAWQTVRRLRGLEQLSRKGALALLDGPYTAGLREVGDLDEALLAAVARRPREWTALTASTGAPSRETFAAFPNLQRLGLKLNGPAPAELFAGTPALEQLSLVSSAPLPPTLLAPLTRLRDLKVTGALPDGFVLPPSLERADLSAPLPAGLFHGTPRLDALRCATSHASRAMFDGLGALTTLTLDVERADPDALSPLVALRHLTLRGSDKAQLPDALLRPLSRLQVLDLGYLRAIEGRHLEGLPSLEVVLAFWNDLSTVPPLPHLKLFDTFAPARLEALEALLDHDPDLPVLDLRWNSASPLYYSLGAGFSEASKAWERLVALLQRAPGLQAVGVHDGLWLARGPEGAWSRLVFRRPRDTERAMALQLAKDLAALLGGAALENAPG